MTDLAIYFYPPSWTCGPQLIATCFLLYTYILSFFSYYFALPWTCGDGGLAHHEAHPICPTFGLGDCTICKIDKKRFLN